MASSRVQGKNIYYFRGDEWAIPLTVKSNGRPTDVSGSTFSLTVNSEEDPPNQDNEQFSVTGVVSTSETGVVTFTPTAAQTDIAPATYYYDIQMVTSSAPRTLFKGKFVLQQDITK